MHGLFTLSLILIAVVESSASSSEFCSTVYSDYHRRQLAYFSEDGVFDIEGGAKHVVSLCVLLFVFSSNYGIPVYYIALRRKICSCQT